MRSTLHWPLWCWFLQLAGLWCSCSVGYLIGGWVSGRGLIGRRGSNHAVILRVEVCLLQSEPYSSGVVKPLPLCELLLCHATNWWAGHGKYLITECFYEHLEGWMAHVEGKEREHWIQVQVFCVCVCVCVCVWEREREREERWWVQQHHNSMIMPAYDAIYRITAEGPFVGQYFIPELKLN